MMIIIKGIFLIPFWTTFFRFFPQSASGGEVEYTQSATGKGAEYTQSATGSV